MPNNKNNNDNNAVSVNSHFEHSVPQTKESFRLQFVSHLNFHLLSFALLCHSSSPISLSTSLLVMGAAVVHRFSVFLYTFPFFPTDIIIGHV